MVRRYPGRNDFFGRDEGFTPPPSGEDSNFIPRGASNTQEGDDGDISDRAQEMIDQHNRDTKDHLPTSHQVTDMNNDFVTNLGKRTRFMFPQHGTYNQVGLVQTARANFRREVNKFNTVFAGEGPRTDRLGGGNGSIGGTVDNDQFFRQTGRLL